MPLAYSLALWTVVVLAVGARFLLPHLPLRRHAVPTSPADLTLLGIGMLGLVLHCTAMFTRPLVEWIPGPAVDQIAGMGTASVIWYLVPAVLVAVGLRRQRIAVQAVVTLALVAVGVTMYNGGSLGVHLAAIFLLVVVLAIVSSALIVARRDRADALPA